MIRRLVIAVFFGVLGSCAAWSQSAGKGVEAGPASAMVPEGGVDGKEEEDGVRQRLEERASARWRALVKRDFESSYRYCVPAYRKLFSQAYFAGQFGSANRWVRASVSRVRVVGKAAEVVMAVAYQIPLTPSPRVVAIELKERWYWQDEDWWYVGEGAPAQLPKEEVESGSTAESGDVEPATKTPENSQPSAAVMRWRHGDLAMGSKADPMRGLCMGRAFDKLTVECRPG